MYSIYTNKMSVIANGVLKHNGSKPKFKGKKTAKEGLQRARKTPGTIPGSKSTNDIHIVDDVESEILNLPELANEKRNNSGSQTTIIKERTVNFQAVDKTDNLVRKSDVGDENINISNKIRPKCDGLQFKQVNNHVTSNNKIGRSELVLDGSSLHAVYRDSNPLVHHHPVHIPTVTSQLTDSVSVSDVLPGRVEENNIEVLAKAGNHKRKDSLILPDQIPGTSYAFEEQNGSLNDSLSIHREFSKLSMTSNKSTESKIPTSVVQIHKSDLEENDQTSFGANESLIQSAIPNLLPGQAIVCLVLNVLIPGTGTYSIKKNQLIIVIIFLSG